MVASLPVPGDGKASLYSPVVRSGGIVSLSDFEAVAPVRMKSGFRSWDRALSGGLAKGYSVVISGEKGSGKSTLLLQAASGLAKRGRDVLIATGEESINVVKLRAERIAVPTSGIRIVESHDVRDVLLHVNRGTVLFLDSLQTFEDSRTKARRKSPAQVEAVAALAIEKKCTAVLVCQITASGDAAGGEGVPHLVDAVLSLSKDGQDRLLTVEKNRFGEEGTHRMTMTPKGLR